MSREDWDAATPQGPRRTVQLPYGVVEGRPRAFALDVVGTCMEPLIPDGSRVVVDPDMGPVPGEPAVVWYRGAACMRMGIWHDLGFAAYVRPMAPMGNRLPVAVPKADIEAAAPVVWCSAWDEGGDAA